MATSKVAEYSKRSSAAARPERWVVAAMRHAPALVAWESERLPPMMCPPLTSEVQVVALLVL